MGPARFTPPICAALAYLRLNQPTRAANQFQKMVDHRGCVQSFLLGTIVHLQLAHGFAAPEGNIKERAAYQDFLTLWRDADPEIPILIAAKSGYLSSISSEQRTAPP